MGTLLVAAVAVSGRGGTIGSTTRGWKAHTGLVRRGGWVSAGGAHRGVCCGCALVQLQAAKGRRWSRQARRGRARHRWPTFASRLVWLQHSFLKRLLKDIANGGRAHPALGRRWKRVTACGRTWHRPAVWHRPDRLSAGTDAAGVASVTGSWWPVLGLTAYASRRVRARSLIDTGLHTGLHTHLRSSVESQAYSHVKAGTGVNSRVRRSRIITCLKGRHALHYLLVLDQHPNRCALAADARRHVGDTTMSNRVRLAAHHDANVHLAPRYWPVAMMEALVADERRCVRLLVGCTATRGPTNSLSQGGVNNQVFDAKPPNFAPILGRFTENAEGFTIAALCHCFLSGFDHRGSSKVL